MTQTSVNALSGCIVQDVPAAEFVASNPYAVWLVGPMFAALTGEPKSLGMVVLQHQIKALFC